MLSYIAEIVECHKICMVIMVVCCCFMHTHKNVMMSNAALCMCNRNSLLNTKILPKTDMYSNYIYI